jgi:hypothetical protein
MKMKLFFKEPEGERKEKWRKCDSQSASLAPIPSQISSIYSLLFSLAKHTFQLSTLHTLKAKNFLLV